MMCMGRKLLTGGDDGGHPQRLGTEGNRFRNSLDSPFCERAAIP